VQPPPSTVIAKPDGAVVTEIATVAAPPLFRCAEAEESGRRILVIVLRWQSSRRSGDVGRHPHLVYGALQVVLPRESSSVRFAAGIANGPEQVLEDCATPSM